MSEQSALAWEDPDELQKQTFASVVRSEGGGYAEVLHFAPHQRRLAKVPRIVKIKPAENEEAKETKELEGVE